MRQTNPYEDWVLLTEIADLGSYTSVAKSRGIAPSTVMRRMKALQDRTGRHLFMESPSGISLTGDGQRLAEQAREIIGQTLHGNSAPATKQSDRMTFWCDGRLWIDGVLGALAGVAREAAASICLTNDPSLKAEADFCLGLPGKATSRSRDQVGTIERTLAAAPGYVARNGLPRIARDLKSRQLVVLQPDAERLESLLGCMPKNCHIVPDMKTAATLAAQASGILFGIPTLISRPWVLSGELTLIPGVCEERLTVRLTSTAPGSLFAEQIRHRLSLVFSA